MKAGSKRSRAAKSRSRPWVAFQPVASVGGIFLLALVLRLLFVHATPDIQWPHSVWYKGDAPLWLDYAAALAAGRPFEQGLPVRPPGNAYLIHWLWDGTPQGVVTLKNIWCLIGAATVALFFVAIRSSYGRLPAVVAGLWMASSTGLMILSGSLNNETPYLFLVALSFWLWPALGEDPKGPAAPAWGAIHGLACLVRVEHVLFFVLATSLWLGRWFRDRGRRSGWWLPLTLMMASYFLVLVPWHNKAWEGCRSFNRQEKALNPATEAMFQQLENRLRGIHWHPDAEEQRQKLPAYSRRTATHMIAATVAVRGRSTVYADDLAILEQAFGSRPESINERPFIALYGGLNFYLANQPDGSGGFSRQGLDREPPLSGGRHLYPGLLISGLPPAQLAFTYPPHAAAVTHGYHLGFRQIRENPESFVALVGRKLRIFWRGASYGFGGHNFPFGLEGARRRVDMVVPEASLSFGLWQLITLGFGVLGLRIGIRRRKWPGLLWAILLVARWLPAILFFGYARHGALLIPLVGLGVGLATEWFVSKWNCLHFNKAILLLGFCLIFIETWRVWERPMPTVDGRPIEAGAPWPINQHEDRQISPFGR